MLNKIQTIRAIIGLLIYLIGLPYFVLRETPAMDTLQRIELAGARAVATGPNEGPWQLTITQNGVTLRRARVDLSVANFIANFGGILPTNTIALVAPNPIYLRNLASRTTVDYEIFELSIRGHPIIAYDEVREERRSDRVRAVVVFTGLIFSATYIWVSRGRGPKASPFPEKQGARAT